MLRSIFACALCSATVAASDNAHWDFELEPRRLHKTDRYNWAGNVEFSSTKVHIPENARELTKIVKASENVRVFGTAHSFNDSADTDGEHVSLEKFRDMKYNPKNGDVTFGAGIRYIELIEFLKEKGRALRNVPSLPHINVVGSVMTGTHGSGIRNQNMAAQVTGIEYVRGEGDRKKIRAKGKDLNEILLSFGTKAIIYEMTMETVPEYGIKKCIYKDVPWDFLRDGNLFESLNLEKDYISFFTDWKDEKMTSVWTADRHGNAETGYDDVKNLSYQELCAPTWHGGKLIERTHPVPLRDSTPCVSSGFGMWDHKIYHFKPDQPPSSDGDEIQSEFFVKAEDLPAAMLDLYAHAETFRDQVQITEVRGVAAD